MARKPSTKRLRASSFRLTVMQRLRRSWTSWSITRTVKAQARAHRRLELLQLETTHQLLRVKELEQQALRLNHRTAETAEAEQWYRGNPVPQPTVQPQPNLRAILEGTSGTPHP